MLAEVTFRHSAPNEFQLSREEHVLPLLTEITIKTSTCGIIFGNYQI